MVFIYRKSTLLESIFCTKALMLEKIRNVLYMCYFLSEYWSRTQIKVLPYNTIREPNFTVKNMENIQCNNLPLVKFVRTNRKYFLNSNMHILDLSFYKIYEQYIVSKWIKPHDIVLEFSDNYGITACTIQMLLSNKTKKYHVLIEPDINTHRAIENNRLISGSSFEICEHMINDNEYCFASFDFSQTQTTNEYEPLNDGIQVIKTISNKDFFTQHPQKFNTIIALSDYAICLYNMIVQNDPLLNQIELIIFESNVFNDLVQECEFMYKIFKKYGFAMCDSIELAKIVNGTWTKYLQVWIKK